MGFFSNRRLRQAIDQATRYEAERLMRSSGSCDGSPKDGGWWDRITCDPEDFV